MVLSLYHIYRPTVQCTWWYWACITTYIDLMYMMVLSLYHYIDLMYMMVLSMYHYVYRPRAGNSLIGFPSESLIFCPKMSEWAIRSKKRVIHSFAHFWWATWAIRSRSLISSEQCERTTHAHFWGATWALRSHRSFLVSDLSNSLTSLAKKEEMSDSLIFQ